MNKTLRQAFKEIYINSDKDFQVPIERFVQASNPQLSDEEFSQRDRTYRQEKDHAFREFNSYSGEDEFELQELKHALQVAQINLDRWNQQKGQRIASKKK